MLTQNLLKSVEKFELELQLEILKTISNIHPIKSDSNMGS